ncbi:MAG: hypothetical protein L0287_09115 [Anaerolineae bacterium]|nr:hypothetical protein [Anaerolineae bacterium]MCI0610984.1 hypothetical protein [Anaerolineae bacterium]
MNFSTRLHKLLAPIILVLAASACGVIPAAEPTIDVREVQTSVFFTMLADVTLSAPVATPAPVFTAALTPTDVSQADYPSVVASRFQTLQETFVEFIEIHTQLTANPNISRNMDWYSQAVAALVKVTNGAAEIARMNNYPPEYAAFHQYMQSMAAEGNLLFSNTMLALDNQDLNAQNQATTNLSNMITSLNQAFAELNRLTPAASPVQTLIPSPSN